MARDWAVLGHVGDSGREPREPEAAAEVDWAEFAQVTWRMEEELRERGR